MSELACHAPFSSMYLTPRGEVLACCFNLTHVLGNVAEQRLADIWWGEQAEELRDAMRAGDLMLGCQFCAWQEDEGAVPPSRGYDRLQPAPGAGWPRRVELAMSNRCNLACAMCHGELSSRIREHREHLPPLPQAYGDTFFADLEAFLPHLDELALLGGEPLLAPEVRRVLEAVARLSLRPSCHITTNGMQVPAWLEELGAQVPVGFAVSLDGASAPVVERIRRGSRHQTLMANLDRLQALCESQGTELTLTYSLMRENWHELADLLLFAEARHLRVYVNLVATPLASSLHTLPPPALDEVLTGLAARDADVLERLELNREVWIEQLDRLRAHRRRTDRPRRSHGAVVVRPRATPVVLASGPAGTSAPSPDPSRLATLPGDGPVDELVCDAAEVVLEARSEGFLGVPAAWCVGRPVVQVVHAVEAALRGEMRVVDEELHPEGDWRRYAVERDGATVAVATMLTVERDADAERGTTWYASWEVAPDDAP